MLVFFLFIEGCSGVSSEFAKLKKDEIYGVISFRNVLLFQLQALFRS